MEQKKRKQVGAVDFFCIGFGAIVGVGWAVSINNWMASSGGPLPAAVGYLLALVMMVPVSLCYCELCTMMPVSGGGMAYAFRAFGDKAAYLSGWAALGAFITIIPWEAIYVVDILSVLFPVLKAGAPLYTLAGAEIYPGHLILGTTISCLLYAINRKGVASSASLQKILCFLLVGSGILAMIFGAMKMNTANFMPAYRHIGHAYHHSFLGGAMTILASAPFFLAGFETIPQGIESAGGSTRSVGKSVVMTVILSCLFYAVLLVTLGGAMPWGTFVHYDNPAVALMFRHLYPSGIGMALYTLILVGAVCGLLTTWNGFMMASSQILMAMARVSIVPHFLSRQHPVYKTPVNALKVCLAASVLGPFLGSGLIGSLTTFSAAGYVLSWMITSFCLIRLRKTEPDLPRPYRIPGGTKTAWFSGIVTAGLFVLLFIPHQPVFIGTLASSLFAGWMVIGGGLFAFTGRERRKFARVRRTSTLYANMLARTPEVNDYSWLNGDFQVMSMRVPEGAAYQGPLGSRDWREKYDVFVLSRTRSDNVTLFPGPEETILSGDELCILGTLRDLEEFQYTVAGPASYIEIRPLLRFLNDQTRLNCGSILVKEEAPYSGKSLGHSGLLENDECVIVGMRRGNHSIKMPSPADMLTPGNVIWAVGSENGLDRLRRVKEA
ncbi:Amino acid transporter [Eubacterium pyruvativorans]|uniref:Amino acid transporter n=1 Tax=Eubacterium pyruvativorans TaxID=155865 RepID=A0A1I7I0G9_9FIRM|nr:amino acid permease [Eubacterium pyruvativorans]SFO35737.1 Amino acid transporter [Eubacterium pyruvativorans]SFU66438.1 Amino acid transporter [Eubacterium pyruvativorans]